MENRAAIIGAGIGGLAAAVQLRKHGWDIEVHERCGTLPETGTALGLWPSALRALDTLGLGDGVRELGRQQTEGAFLRPDGSVIARIKVSGPRRRGHETVHLLSRPPLLRTLLDELEPGTVHFGSAVPDVGALRGYDVVIAADGIASQARTALFGPAYRPRPTGSTAWRGSVPGDTDTVTETWGAGARFGITPQEGGRINWFATELVAPGQSCPNGEVSRLRALFGQWHGAVRRILDQLTEDQVLRHDLHYLAPALPSYVRGNVALIGDAAHAMPPDLGRGACEALVDGVTLARFLTEDSGVPQALTKYDAERRKPTQRLVGISRTMHRVAHARRWTALRNTAVRIALAIGRPPA